MNATGCFIWKLDISNGCILELRPSLGSLESLLGKLENSAFRSRSRLKMLKKNYSIFPQIERRSNILCLRSLRSKLNARHACFKNKIKTWQRKVENICTLCVVKLRKDVGFIFFFKIHTKVFELLEYLLEVGIDCRFSSIMLGKCLVLHENCSKSF